MYPMSTGNYLKYGFLRAIRQRSSAYNTIRLVEIQTFGKYVTIFFVLVDASDKGSP